MNRFISIHETPMKMKMHLLTRKMLAVTRRTTAIIMIIFSATTSCCVVAGHGIARQHPVSTPVCHRDEPPEGVHLTGSGTPELLSMVCSHHLGAKCSYR